jgi:hypothetical protein
LEIFVCVDGLCMLHALVFAPQKFVFILNSLSICILFETKIVFLHEKNNYLLPLYCIRVCKSAIWSGNLYDL